MPFSIISKGAAVTVFFLAFADAMSKANNVKDKREKKNEKPKQKNEMMGQPSSPNSPQACLMGKKREKEGEKREKKGLPPTKLLCNPNLEKRHRREENDLP